MKLERGGASVERARAIVRSGIPVMGHVGLTPQTVERPRRLQDAGEDGGKRRAGGRGGVRASGGGLLRDRLRGGAVAITEALVPKLDVPVIGIGAGPATAGQVLVFHDLLGIHKGHIPKFVKRYAEVGEAMTAGVRAFADEVRSGQVPGAGHTYSVEPEELEAFERYLEQDSLAAASAWDW